jgi:hypothetical protein
VINGPLDLDAATRLVESILPVAGSPDPSSSVGASPSP